MTKKSKCLLRTLFIFLLSTLIVFSFVLSVNAVEPIDLSDDTNGVVTRTLNVTEYDFTTNTERTYDIVYRIIFDDVEEEIMSITPSDEPPASPNNIIGDPDWEPLNSSLYDDRPYSAVCKTIARTTDNRYSQGTAFLVGKRVALTVAHVVYSKTTSEWMEDIHVTPHPPAGQSDTTTYNRGTDVLKAIMPTARKTSSSREYDWAIILLEDDLGTTNGMWTLNVIAPNTNSPVYIAGYPGGYGGAMYRSFGIVYSKTTSLLRYTCDTDDGMSGSPVYTQTTVNGTTTYKVVAIHASGPNSNYNEGVLINQFITTEVGRLNGIYS